MLGATEARAEFLPGAPRAITLSDSASRDAPVVELAYGPRPQISLGGELGLYLGHREHSDVRVSVYVLFALDNGTSLAPPPDELYRLLYGFTVSRAWTAPRRLGGVGTLELSVSAGRAQSGTLGGYVLPDVIPNDGIPFGGGGTFITPELAWRRPFSHVDLTLRLGDAVHLPAFALLFGQRPAADALADATSDALINQTSLDVIVRWRATPRFQPLLSAHADLLIPIDEIARIGYFARGLLGVAIKGRLCELIPFLSMDVGNGQGELINRHELRLSAGIRYATF